PAVAQQERQAADSLRDDRDFSFYDRGPYRPAVPHPETILGYDLGQSNTQFLMQERVLLAIAEAARDRVRVETIGATNEGRPMRLFLVSAPEHIARLDAIRAELDRLADPRGAAQAELEALVERVPAVVWINESVHGNESPGFETAMQTLYQLAASEEPATVEALRQVLVVLNPSTNPDGHERFAVWYNSIGVRSPDPGSLEKFEPWSIQGRYNHYRFDLNRDVMTTTQREARALVAGYLRWHPMVAIDQHGQTPNYFFPPTAAPLNANLAGTTFDQWMEIYGRANAQAFDRYGWMYYSRDVFDFYGPFYWDSWPSLTGAIGMTYETDGGGHRGLVIRRPDGSLLSFRDGIAKHYVTALATIQTTAQRRLERVRDFLGFRQGAIAEGRTGPMKRIVFLPGTDPARAAELAAALLRSGIEVRRATAPFSATRAHAYADDSVRAARFEAGAYVVDLAQPQGRLAKAFLEPSPALDSAFVRSQLDRFRRNQRRGARVDREGYEFYDVTAWSLPVTFGVEAFWTEDSPPVTGEMLRLPADTSRQLLVNGELLPVEVPSGIVGGGRAQSAYVFPPERNGALRLAYQLMAQGFRVAAAVQPVEAGGRKLPRGTYVVRVARNDSTLHTRIAALARESGVEVFPIGSAFTESGQYGIGSGAVVDLREPKVALVGNDGIAQTAYGAIWWTLEQRYGMAFTPLAATALGGDLSRFNVVIIPDGSSGFLTQRVGSSGADGLRAWVRNGGTLITMGGATAWAAHPDINLTSARMHQPDTTAGGKAAADSAARRQTTRDDLLPVTSPSAWPDVVEPLAGSHFDVLLDRTHWLTHGYQEPRLTVMFDGANFLKLSREGTNVAVFPAEGKVLRAGFAFPDNTERLLRNTSLVIEEPVGDGHIVLFNNEPMFRAWWRALDRLVLNAVVLGPGM
ncbi:MAG TPA: M14 family zinc carboxypeptidase, partial [Gemmatimonadales bacterium]|nr:M14 family zinc carboxypeptidase [Gemmatimonadales bacterium]